MLLVVYRIEVPDGPVAGLLIVTVTAKVTTWLVGRTTGESRGVRAAATELETDPELMKRSGREEIAAARNGSDALVPQLARAKLIEIGL